MKNIKTVATFVVSFALAAMAGVATAKHLSKDNVEKRLAPVHSVYVEGDEVPVVANEMPVVESSGPRTAVDIYNTNCMACHASGAAGAPKVGDAAVWESRLSAGIETVYNNAINGVNAMPPRGMCSDCSDDEIKAVVDHMLENSK